MVVAPALVEIGVLALALLCLALALVIVQIMRKVGDLVRGITIIGGPIAGVVDSLAQGITTVLGKAIGGVEAAIGASWHLLARYTDKLWHQVEAQALGYAQLAELVARLVYSHSGLKTLVHRVEATVHGIEHGVKTLEREWRGIEHRVKTLERDITKGIGHDLHIGLRDLQKTVRGIRHTVTTTIPQAIDYAEGKTDALGNFIKAIPGVGYAEWAGALVLAGLGVLGLRGLHCDNNPLKNKDCGSSVWGDLESLLIGAAAFGIALNLGDIVEAAVAVEKEAAGALQALVAIDDSVIRDAAAVVGAAANAVST